ncbi:CAMK/CAMKL protein kinase [Loa loa]|uniref:CAMK/CAMKL protein kinase n=2 Tax=Loa loa TaxID=7209 RepID=A0A1I7V7K7_LOALO|nr:CAMK/CAMKL protein kinase [Loa loa]EFO16008.1 CAMK/CAMKL protein kinase [Loa loa]
MDTTEKSSRLDTEIIITKSISPSDSFIVSKIDAICSSAKCNLNLKKNKIDESRMPLSQRGKQWTLKRAIGEGTNFKTYLATNNDGEIFAIRKNRKQDWSTDAYEDDEKAQEEIANTIKLQVELDLEMMKLIGVHSNITALIGFRQIGLCWEQFMEYIDGGCLFDYINENYIKENRLLEIEKAQSFFSDLLSAVEHIHSLKIAHMDIKLENCLITKNGIVKLTDFDEARYFIPNLKLPYPVYFTISYAAPETFTKRYRPNCADIWACGIFLYFLLQKRLPWNVANSEKDAIYAKWLRMDEKNLLLTFPECYGCVSGELTDIA